MAAIHWANDTSGDFGDGSNWAGGVAPGTSDDAILDAPGSVPYFAQAAPVSGQTTVSSIQLAADAFSTSTAQATPSRRPTVREAAPTTA